MRSSTITGRSGTLDLRQLFAADPARAERLVTEVGDLRIDWSKHIVTRETVRLLVALAEASGLVERRDAMFRGERINTTEDRAVLHVALRAPPGASIEVDGVNVVPAVHEVLGRMAVFSDEVRSGAWRGATGERIRTIVNIGIGGSDLGPAMAYQALRSYATPELSCRFVSNVDGADMYQALSDLDPATTMFVISSKTFSTIETLTNARTARNWLTGARRRSGRRPALRRRLDQRRVGVRVRHRHPEHVRVLGLGRRPVLGRLGDRPVVDARHRGRWLP